MIVEIAIETAIEGNSTHLDINLVICNCFSFYFRSYDRRNDYRNKTSNYDSEESDGEGNNYSNEPNNKVIVRGLAAHITEADVSSSSALFVIDFNFYLISCVYIDSM